MLSPLLSPMAFVAFIWLFYCQCSTPSPNPFVNHCTLVEDSIVYGETFISDTFNLTREQREDLAAWVRKWQTSLQADEANFWGFFTKSRGNDFSFFTNLYALITYLAMLRVLFQGIAFILTWVQLWLEIVEHLLFSSCTYLAGLHPNNALLTTPRNLLELISVGSEVLGLAYTRYLLEAILLPFTERVFTLLNTVFSFTPSSPLLCHPMGYQMTNGCTSIYELTPVSAWWRFNYLYAASVSRMWRILVVAIIIRLNYLCTSGLCTLSAAPLLFIFLVLLAFFPTRLFVCLCPDHPPGVAYNVFRK